MANEKDPPPPATPPAPVEGVTKQFTLKMSSWLTDLASDFNLPTEPAPEAPVDQLLQPEEAKPGNEPAPGDDLSLEATLFKSEFPPKL